MQSGQGTLLFSLHTFASKYGDVSAANLSVDTSAPRLMGGSP